ncbi:P-loop containing nucleoside triphosphate hydrolase protein [Hypoxylon sp. FL1857]|nr:P-loop containing nucleoside triphosphate hydrolase protein [Hypoxylon sp. FL1857]
MEGIGVKQLHEEQKDLLDMIDNLRNHGLYYPLNLPKIVVIGETSAGKSSLLEALSAFCFSAKDGLYTTFATELILSTASQQKIDVRIQSSAASREEATSYEGRVIDKDTVASIIEEFEPTILKDGAAFSEDILKIKISGPNVPHLTLVDLPGFHHSEDGQPAIDRGIVNRLVERYTTCENSIVLVVIPASEELKSQDVKAKIQCYDSLKDRTIGIITKIDSLAPHSECIQDLVQLVKNTYNSIELPLGLHVIQNQGATGSSGTDEQSDEEDRCFLESSPWSAIHSKDRGIESLRKKLSGILLKHIKNNLHDLIENIEEKIHGHKIRLERLGNPRLNPKEQRMHLDKIASRFNTLCLQAVEGNYEDEFFGSLFIDEEASSNANRIRKLRALIHDLTQSFVYVLETKGSRRTILPKSSKASQRNTTDSELEANLPGTLQALVGQYKFEDPEKVTFEAMAADLGQVLSTYQGTSNDRLAMNLFRDQSQPWEPIARRHIQLMLTVTKAFVGKLLGHITHLDEKTYSAILSEVVEPFFDQKSTVLEEKLQELLRHYKNGHNQPHNTKFQNLLGRKRRRSPGLDELRDLIADRPEFFTQEARLELEKVRPSTIPNSSGAQDVIDKAEAYYEMSLRTFTDNVIILAVENCLIKDLPSIVTAGGFSQMEDAEIGQLASEAPEIQEERKKLQEDCEAFEEGLRICNKYKLRKFTSVPSIIDELEKAPSTRVESTSPPRIENAPTTESPQTTSARSNIQEAADTASKPEKTRSLFVTDPPPSKGPLFGASSTHNSFGAPSSSSSPSKTPSVLDQKGGNNRPAPPAGLFRTVHTPANATLAPSGGSLFNHQRLYGEQFPAVSTFRNGNGPAQTNHWSTIGSGLPILVSLPMIVPEIPVGPAMNAFNHICFLAPYSAYSPEELRCLAYAALASRE